ncbi:hypothetical protein ARMGADRAFT_1082280 [Armillaria gallica]|uniref:Uncharacterized protein n=1 Tax=Armillaria gallica TaxID=47427 RepID=A0A2H3D730_ARMGA|nr:hypothetical protein ARMGADRAFT_1082280 [Armillaria gallica]
MLVGKACRWTPPATPTDTDSDVPSGMISAYRRNLQTAEHIQIVATFYEIYWRIAALRPGNWEQMVTGTQAHAMLGGREFIYEILRPLEEALSTMISPLHTLRAQETDLWPPNSLEQDTEDPHVVTEYLTTYFGYHIDLIVGHCCGTILVVRWLCTTGEGKTVSGFENVSSRYRMRGIYDSDEIKESNEGFVNDGFHFLNPKVKIKIYPEDIRKMEKGVSLSSRTTPLYSHCNLNPAPHTRDDIRTYISPNSAEAELGRLRGIVSKLEKQETQVKYISLLSQLPRIPTDIPLIFKDITSWEADPDFTMTQHISCLLSVASLWKNIYVGYGCSPDADAELVPAAILPTG